MLLRLLLLFTLVPLVELALLIWIGQYTGLGFTIALVLLTGIVGAALARYEGLRCWRRVHQEMAAGRLPGDPLLDGLMILIAGALLVTPGILTDLLGFALLTPPLRRLLKNRIKRRIQARLETFSAMQNWPPGEPDAHDRIIDVRVTDAPDEQQQD